MKILKYSYLMLPLLLLFESCQEKGADRRLISDYYNEPHRLQFHFSPDSMWMNDPNGMVYFAGEYHMFYQYYPDDIVWGPMHWGHAISKDLIHWEHMPIAIYPDSLGWIFSGCAVADLKNTSGFGTRDNPPLVAIYTYHDSNGEKAGKADFQTQGIAYSVDKGRTWEKYQGNPVLRNPGIKDYRDPKVIWHEETKKWIMILAVKDRVHLYSSADLKAWNKESEFGADKGAHGGVWECPDLIPMTIGGQTKWVMLVSINPGGPNGGSATQYFVGDFNGSNFNVDHDDIRWLDWGPDNYAGVTWSNVSNRHLFIGWMSNWAYATQVPTEKWRSSMTVPRSLKLSKVDNKLYVVSEPVVEYKSTIVNSKTKKTVKVDGIYNLSGELNFVSSTFSLEFVVDAVDFSVKLSNDLDEHVTVGFDARQKQFYIDRRNSGKTSFNELFPGKNTAERISADSSIDFKILVDVGSVELFADGGEVVMTSLFFPNEKFTRTELIANNTEIKKLNIGQIKSIWTGK
jgi:fructan beta-fructosidase